jgi:hypothetical protein
MVFVSSHHLPYQTIEPLDRMLRADARYHVKRCLLGQMTVASKHLASIKNSFRVGILAFLASVEKGGAEISSRTNQIDGTTILYTELTQSLYTEDGDEAATHPTQTVGFEARQIKNMFLRMFEDASIGFLLAGIFPFWKPMFILMTS